MGRNHQKEAEVASIVDHIIETYRPHEIPVVLMWKEIYNSHVTKNFPGARTYSRSNSIVEAHWKMYSTEVMRELESRYGLTIVKVNDRVRKVAQHGKEPKRVNKNQNDAAYKACIPCSGNKAMGFVSFPKNTLMDHPLIKETMILGSKGASTFALNNKLKLDKANGRGTLSDECREEIMNEIVIPKVMKVIEDKRSVNQLDLDQNGDIARKGDSKPKIEVGIIASRRSPSQNHR